MKALIVENSRLYRKLLESLLGQYGFEMDITDSLTEARNYVDHQQFDLICLNDHLKDGRGDKLIRYCQRHPEKKRIPILFCTADEKFKVNCEYQNEISVIIKRELRQITDQVYRFLDLHSEKRELQARVLLVEDSQSIARLISDNLSAQNYQVVHFRSADKAWQAFQDEKTYGSAAEAYDLVVSDIYLDGHMTGLKLTEKIRSMDDARGHVPIIAMTSKSDDKLRLSLYRAGVSDFILKPVLIEELLLRAANLISNKRLLDKVHDQRRELYALATTDKLTGCHNRHSLMDFSKKLMAQAQRHQFPVSLLVIDLDHFKNINDTHGHAVGDIVLSSIGELLLHSFREDDMVARFGGEEFVVLMGHCQLEQALKKAEVLRKRIESLDPHNLKITASIGASCQLPTELADFENLFQNADQCVYQAKEGGRNQVVGQAAS